MNKMNCDIIQDLIPSYVDELCSDATKVCVEEHVRECISCRKQIEICRDSELSDRNIEQKQIEVFKKFHNKMKFMNLFCMALVLMLIGLGTYTFCTNYISLSPVIYYVLFPLCMIGLYLFAGTKGNMKRAEKKDYMIAALSIIDTASAIVFILYSINRVRNEKTVFSIENAQLGPFIHKVWGILFLFLVIGFVYLLLRMIRNNINNKGLMCLQMMGMFLLLAYVTLLRELTSANDFYGLFARITAIIVAMGFAGSILFAVTGQKKEKTL